MVLSILSIARWSRRIGQPRHPAAAIFRFDEEGSGVATRRHMQREQEGTGEQGARVQ